MSRRALAGLLVAACLSLAGGASQDAESLWQQGERLRAVELMQQQLAQRADDEGLRSRLAERLMLVHRYAAAAEVAAPLGARLAGLRGRALYLLGRYDEALELLRQDDPLEALMRVDAYEVLGQLEPTRAALTHAAALLGADDPRLLVIEGRLCLRQQAWTEAVALFERALERDPVSPAAVFGLGQALVRAGRRDEGLAMMQRHRELVPLIDARDAALQALDMGPLHADNHAALGDAERGLGRAAEALAAYARASELARPEQLTPIALRQARLLAEDLQRPAEAVALLDAAIARVPDLRLLVRAGDVLLAARQPALALTRFETALGARPGDPALLARRDAARAALADGAVSETPATPGASGSADSPASNAAPTGVPTGTTEHRP